MAKVNLSGMTVEALMDLRKRVDEMLVKRRAELQKQLERIAVVGGARVVGGVLRGTLCRGVVASVRDHRHLELAPVLGVRRSSRAPCAGQQLLQEPRHNGRPRFRVRDRWRPLQHRPAVGAQVEPPG